MKAHFTLLRKNLAIFNNTQQGYGLDIFPNYDNKTGRDKIRSFSALEKFP
jgi:hypothetical protein